MKSIQKFALVVILILPLLLPSKTSTEFWKNSWQRVRYWHGDEAGLQDNDDGVAVNDNSSLILNGIAVLLTIGAGLGIRSLYADRKSASEGSGI